MKTHLMELFHILIKIKMISKSVKNVLVIRKNKNWIEMINSVREIFQEKIIDIIIYKIHKIMKNQIFSVRGVSRKENKLMKLLKWMKLLKYQELVY